MAIEQYDNYFEKRWNKTTECLHPDDLEETHREAICRALTVFRPKKQCSAGFDYNDEDELTLHQVILLVANTYCIETVLRALYYRIQSL